MFSQLSVMYFISCALTVGGWMRACTCALALNITLGRAGQAARCENFQINATRFGESAHSRASSRQTHGTQAAPPLLFDARIMQSICARVAQRNSCPKREPLCAPYMGFALAGVGPAAAVLLLRRNKSIPIANRHRRASRERRPAAGQMLSADRFN
jgi:hypothetical protein